MPTTVIAIPAGTGSFMIPADFPSGGTLQVECVGAGGQANSGGGAYSKTTSISVNPLQTVYIQVGTSDTWFNKTSNAAPTSTTDGCLAKAGTPLGTDLAPGGQSSAGVGDVKYSGGNGGSWTEGPPDIFGGGGGAAGPNGAGASAGVYPNNGGGGANVVALVVETLAVTVVEVLVVLHLVMVQMAVVVLQLFFRPLSLALVAQI